MANWKFVLFCMFVILGTNNVLVSGANDDRKVHIIYMGSLPKEDYSLASHHLNMLQQVIDDDFAENFLVTSYKRSFNGFAANLTDKEVENIGRMEGVVSVFESKKLELHTTRSWDFLGFQETTKTSPTESDMIIGVFDSGVWPESDSFNDEGFGPAPKKWKGTCAGGTNFTCNNKIIGARYYSKNNDSSGSARDTVGHGSHTASTAAGNKVKGTSFFGIAEGTARGGVPSARIAVYKVCDRSYCGDAQILAAFDDAIADGVDIVTISLGGDPKTNFTDDSIAIGSFHAMEKGILTLNSGGNSGPLRSSTPSLAPWLFSVAASSTDRRIIDKISLGNGVTLTGQSVNTFTSNGTKFPLITGRKASTPDCPIPSQCLPHCLDPTKVEGKIVICSSSIGYETGLLSGASGTIVDGIDGNISYVVPYPALALDSDTIDILYKYYTSTTSPQAEILRSEVVNDTNAPAVTDFSSRGPNSILPEIMKPDISAPGLDILAAYPPNVPPSESGADKRSSKFTFQSGTSMACPHVAGVAAYVKSFHPDWSPAAIKSSIMTTSTPMKGTEDKEFAYGSGQVNPIKAINPGLIFDLSKDDYVNLLCIIGYDTPNIRKISGDNTSCPSSTPQRSTVKDFNYPALAFHAQPNQPFVVNFTRTVTNVGFANSTYKVSVPTSSDLNVTVVPQVISFKSLNEKQSFVVNVVGGKFPQESVVSSSLEWTDGTHNVRSPIVVDVSQPEERSHFM
ncbi:hypothetical protein Lal_00025600 [Lupinus albus]|uniref:Putative cucumisin n=1 Tax=Lupinus albus TaxID=3870 RepID=A0A6A4PXJ2_LUPAL|nr:putative cucumisin [Lupinus albus]KAF1890267.1 hypothetical protein Lal_00025600 [Lupinus albus]